MEYFKPNKFFFIICIFGLKYSSNTFVLRKINTYTNTYFKFNVQNTVIFYLV